MEQAARGARVAGTGGCSVDEEAAEIMGEVGEAVKAGVAKEEPKEGVSAVESKREQLGHHQR